MPDTQVHDETLYRRYLDGDEGSMRELMERYGNTLTLYINGYVKNLPDAEDLMIEAFAYLATKRPAIRDCGFKAYLFKAARNYALRFMGKQRFHTVFGLGKRRQLQLYREPCRGLPKGRSFAVKANGTALTEAGGKYTITNITEDKTVTVEGVEKIPVTALEGEIKVSTNGWKQFLNTITFGLFFKDTQTVTITATEGSTIEYFTSADALNEETVKAKADGWQSYGAFSIAPDSQVIVYAKITKGTDSLYLRTDRITVDGTAPTFSLANGQTYTSAQTLTVSDNYSLSSVLLNNTEQLATGFEGKAKDILLSANGTYIIKAADQSGNKAEITVTIAIPAPPVTYNLVGITAPTAITGVTNGIGISSIELPATVAIDTGTGGPTSASVTWRTDEATPTYDPAIKTEQTFTIPGTVTLPGNVTNTSSVSLEVSISVTVAAKVEVTLTGIGVKTQPTKTTYTEGEALGLSGLVVTLTYSDSTTEDVAFADFGTKGITVNPTNGTVLTTADTAVIILVSGKSASVTITVNAMEQAAAPTFSPAGGTYTTAQTVTISSSTQGTSIYYTTDGTEPTTGSTLYSDAITVSSTTTIKAIAVKSGMKNSTVSSASYTINIAPAFVAVTDITGVATTMTAGTPLTLSGTVEPSNATNKTIVWSVKSAGSTGASISGNTLFATAAGTVTVTATVTNGRAASSDYTKDFAITVSAAPVRKYTLTVNSGTGGGNYAEGEAVIIAASAAPSGQRFKEWTGTDGLIFTDSTSKTSATAKFTMPGKAVTVTATYEDASVPVTKYTLTVKSGTGGGSFAQGETVTITASTAPSGKRFKEWTGTDGLSFTNDTSKTSATAKFTMPGKAVTVTATYEDASVPVTKYTLTVNSGTGGRDYAEGETVTITASTAQSGKRFKEWTGTDGLSFTDGTSKTSATAKFTMPGKAVTVTATYEQIPFAYTITGGANSIWSGTGNLIITCNGSFSAFQAAYMDGVALTSKQASVVSGSTILTLKEEYLKTLSIGTHTLRFVYADGYAETQLTISAGTSSETPKPETKPTNPPTGTPQTGDNSMMPLWLTLMFASIAGILILYIIKRKRSAK